MKDNNGHYMYFFTDDAENTLLDEYSLLRFSTEQTIKDFVNLQSGWHYGKGDSFLHDTIQSALEINRHAELKSFSTNAFPGISGYITVVLYFADDDLEFRVFPDGNINFVHDRNGDEIESIENLSLEKAFNKIAEYSEKLWNILDSSTVGITTKYEEGSSLMPSPITMEVSPFSKKSAQKKSPVQSVGISQNIINSYQENPKFFGQFLKGTSPWAVSL